MILFTSSRLAMAMQNCKGALEEIARIIAGSQICQPAEFMQAVEKGDAERINGWIETAIDKFTGQDNTIYGLRAYCQKFGLNPGAGATEEDMLLLISQNAAAIDSQLKSRGL